MKYFVVIYLTLLLGGCIENDIPLPVVYGNVEKMEFSGQEKCVINTKDRTVEVTLSDTVNIERVRLMTLDLVAEPAREQEVKVKPHTTLAVDSFVNLSVPLGFSIYTYQKYDWVVVGKQEIERYFRVANQAREAIINVKERMVKIIVNPDQDLSDIQVEDVKLGSSLATYYPEPQELRDFTKQQQIYVTCFGKSERWLVAAVKEDAEEQKDVTGTVDAWAKFAYFNGNVPAGEIGEAYFEYKQARASSWKRVEAKVEGRRFSAKVTGLRPKTDYVVRGVFDKKMGSEVAFKTEAAEQVPYSNFDLWYKKLVAEKESACMGEEGIVCWDSGNEGGAAFGFNPTTEESNEVIKGSAARLQSCYAAVKFAAGSIYTGKFAGLDGFNAKLDFGIPYQCRPTTLSGYYKYVPGVVNRTPKKDSRFDFLKGKPDSCHIYVALCDWKEPFHVNTKTETLLDCSENNPSIIAYGELKTDRTMSDYKKFTIDIQYRDRTRKPTYIVIVATSSKYGDYFAGSDTSLLLLDEFELGFD